MTTTAEYPYDTRLDVLYPALEVVDVASLVEACTSKWYNQTLSKVNDSVVRLGVVEGEYHWHKHDDDDEFFFVLDGNLIVDTRDGSISLAKHEGIVVPKGVMHRTRAERKTIILMVETASVVPTGSS